MLLDWFIESTNVPMNFASYSKLKFITAVNIIRLRGNHFVNIDSSHKKLIGNLPKLTIHKEDYQSIGEKLKIELSPGSILQLFITFVRTDFSITLDQLNRYTKKDNDFTKPISLLSNLLDELSSKFMIPLLNLGY